MLNARLFSLLGLVALTLVTPAFAQDSKPAGEAPVDLVFKSSVTVDKTKDKTNYVHYFTWQQLSALDVEVGSASRCHAEKWMKGYLAKKKKTAHVLTAEKPKGKFHLTIDVAIKYVELKMEMDGKKATTGHSWQGTIKGKLTDSNGKVVKDIDLKHRWGTNLQVKRKRGRLEYMRHMTMWVLLELLETPDFAALIPEAKKEDMNKQLASLKKQKDKLYDSEY